MILLQFKNLIHRVPARAKPITWLLILCCLPNLAFADLSRCDKPLSMLYVPIATSEFMEPLFKDLHDAVAQITGCQLTFKVAIDYRDFVERLALESFDLVLAPAHSVQAVAHKLHYRPLVATERLFSARLISSKAIDEEELVSSLIGKTLYTPDVLSGVFMALEQWLSSQNIKFRVRLQPGQSHDELIKDVASKKIEFAAVADVFVTDSIQSDIHTVVYLPMPLGPLYILNRADLDTNIVSFLRSAFLSYENPRLQAFLKTEKPFVPASTYPSSFFTDAKRRFIQLMNPHYFLKAVPSKP